MKINIKTMVFTPPVVAGAMAPLAEVASRVPAAPPSTLLLPPKKTKLQQHQNYP